MKKIILLITLTTINVFSWEINTHRAIERKAIEASANLKTFVENSGISTNTFFYDNERLEGYNQTYIKYIERGETNGISISKWKQDFININLPSYQKMIEAGSILEDAQWPHGSNTLDVIDRADGRFVNHFYDPQDGGKGYTAYNVLQFQNVLSWATVGRGQQPTPLNPIPIGVLAPPVLLSPAIFSSNDNDYDYNLALEYFKLAFTSSDPDDRRRYQAKMFVSLGHLMHFMNDMVSPAHTRNDGHPEGDAMEVYGRGGENGNVLTGFRIKGNGVKDYLGIVKPNGSVTLPKISKYSKFSDFITKEARWTATHFFSNDTIFTKPLPSVSTTYEFLESNKDGVKKYYIKSNGTGSVGCDNGCVPVGTKLGIRIKSWILDKLELYYPNHAVGNTSTFKGDYSVLQDNAKVLIPRAIANARNFLDYFFKIQIKAEIQSNKIKITNISDKSLVNNDVSTSLDRGGCYEFMYDDSNGQRKFFPFIINLTDDDKVPIRGLHMPNRFEYIPGVVRGFCYDKSIAPQTSFEINIEIDTKGKWILANNNITVVYHENNYYDTINGLVFNGKSSVCKATKSGLIASSE